MKNKIINVSMILIGVILAIFGISQLVKYEIVLVQGSQAKVNAPISIGTLASEEIDPSTYKYNIYTGTFTIYKEGNSFGLPSYAGFQIYCINPGQSLKYDYDITFDEAHAYDEHEPYKSDCGCASTPGAGSLTPISYSEYAEHILPASAAYIVSDEPIGGWSEEKQKGIWNLKNIEYDSEIIMGENTSKNSGPSIYDQEAKYYSEYDAKVRNEGLKPTDKTNSDDMKVLVNTTAKEYIVGPFNVEYTNGVYGNIAFAGISEMKIVGYNENKKQVREDIQIEKILLKDEATGLYEKAMIPEYFEPSKDLKVDETAQIYPASGQDFKVVFKNPNEGMEDEKNQVKYISIKVKFKYMLANGKYMQIQGIKFEVMYEHDHTHNPHQHTYSCTGCKEEEYPYKCKEHGGKGCTPDMIYYCDQPGCTGHEKGWWCPGHIGTRLVCPGGHLSDCNGCITDCYLGRHTQQWLMAADGIRSIYEQEIELAKDEPVKISIDIRGDVWKDKKTGKENALDGIKGDNEPAVVGIPVIIYSTDGKVAKATKTNKNGEYSFDELDAMKKYYVEFRYNGQQYENTVYTNNLSGGYSNATESVEDRNVFNKKFEEIDGDEGYILEQLNRYTPDSLFGISAYTGSNGKEGLQVYPKYSQFAINDTDVTMTGIKYEAIYEKGNDQREVDFGITKRVEFDIALKKDVYIATVKVNGKTEVYGYDKKNIGENDKISGDTWNVQNIEGYTRKISKDDYTFTGQNGNDELLEVYVTYKIAVRNQSQSMLGHVTKLYDYFDDTYTYMPELSWTSTTNYTNDSNTLNSLQDEMKEENIDIREWGEEPKLISNENNKLTIDVNKKQQVGETVYLYLTFKIDGEGPELTLGEKGNSAEVGSFKTYYKAGTILPHYGKNNFVVQDDNMIAGRVDKDSIPSTMGQEGKPVEDDEDKAPSLKVESTGEERKLNGTVWEDERTLKSGEAVIGNGLREEHEIGIAGIKVQLWEITPQGEEYLWKETKTDVNGKYNFEGYVAGDYFVRFYYGYSKDTVQLKKNPPETHAEYRNGRYYMIYDYGGKNAISYNGQDYKSTSYQVGVTQNEYTDTDNIYQGYKNVETQNVSKTYGYDIAEAESKNVSDAKDIWERRQVVNSYSKENVTNGIAEILASPYVTPKYNGSSYSKTEMNILIEEFIRNTSMIAETGVIVVEVEKNTQSQDEANENPSYDLLDIDFGLEERPKAQLEIDKSISNIKVTLANGSMLFDVNKGADNVIWKIHEPYDLDSSENKDIYGKYEGYYKVNNKNRYSYRNANSYPIKAKDRGIVQITMDEELMHGATIQITYKVKVRNVGEVDYKEEKFYYLGDSLGATAVTTRANQVVDYVANNLKFNADDVKNSGWNIIKKDELLRQNLVNSRLRDNLGKVNNVIQTEELNKELVPKLINEDNSYVEKTLVLTQLISNQNTSDDLTYSNMVEIVKTSNTVGRRMAYSVVGNQHPDASKAEEIDSNLAERVIILPPFGETQIMYILGIVIAIILIGGVTFIIKKV